MASLPTGKSRAASLLERRARQAVQGAFKKLTSVYLKSVAELVVDKDGVFSGDSAIVHEAVKEGLEGAEQRIQKQYQELYPSLVARTMLDAPLRRDYNSHLRKAFQKTRSQWRSTYRLKRKPPSARFGDEGEKFVTARQRMKKQYGTQQPKPVKVGNRTYTYDRPFRKRMFGLDSGMWAAGMSKRITTRVNLEPQLERSQHRFRLQVREMANTGVLAPDPEQSSLTNTNVALDFLKEDFDGLEFAVRSDRTLSRATDIASRRLEKRVRKSSSFPFNSRRLAIEALAEAIDRAL